MSRVNGGQLLVEVLAQHGARLVFSIIGGQMCSIYDELERRPEMKLITLRNEAAAPIMAAGAAAVSGLPAVSMCTVGAGVVYEAAGLLAAWHGYLPVVSIAPQVQSWKMNPHQENLQGLNQHRLFEPITKWSAIVYHFERIPQLTHRAIREALANAPGPVHLDLPVDVLFQSRKLSAREKARLLHPPAHTRFSGSLPGPAAQVKRAGESLLESQRPLVLVGQAMGRAGRYPALREHLNRLGAPALLGDASSGIMNAGDPAHVSALGLFLESESGRRALSRSDLILLIGLDDQLKEAISGIEPDKPLVQVEVDPSALLVGRKNHLGVNADPVSFLTSLGKGSAGGDASRRAWLEEMQRTAEDLAGEVSESLPRLSSLFTGLAPGLGDHDLAVVDGAEPVRAARAFLSGSRAHALFLMNARDLAGAGLPFAIGARIACPDKAVLLIADRDSLLRQVQELQTAQAQGAGISIVITDPGGGESRTRIRAILEGLGCEVHLLKPGRSVKPSSSAGAAAWLSVDDGEGKD